MSIQKPKQTTPFKACKTQGLFDISISRIPAEFDLSKHSRNLYAYSEVEGNYLGISITGTSERFYVIPNLETAQELGFGVGSLLVEV